MRIAVTGASGTVGRAVVAEALRRGHDVTGIDINLGAEGQSHPNLTRRICDLTDYGAALRALDGAEGVINLATQAGGSAPDAAVHNPNVTSGYNVLRAAAELGIRRLCMGSSVNAIGLSFSRAPRFNYFPLDEDHPTYNEDAYGLSKWITEVQADSIARRYEQMTISSLRFHWAVADRSVATTAFSRRLMRGAGLLWGYTPMASVVASCFLALDARFSGHQVFNIVAPDTCVDVPSMVLARRFYPGVPIREPLAGNASFFTSRKASLLLGDPGS